MRMIHKGHIQIILTNGKTLHFGNLEEPAQIIEFRDYFLPLKIMMNSIMALGEAYMDERLVIQKGTLYQFMEILAFNYARTTPALPERLIKLFSPLLRIWQQYNHRRAARRNVAHHYDLSNDFYKLFLDHDMQYSCAYFESANEDLETAQFRKKEHIAQKLLVKPGMKVLDIGCGWGGMALYLAKQFNVEVVGLTLSVEQHKLATLRAQQAGLSDKVKFYLRDYRDETESYDRIVSVGMFEHVGSLHYREFFSQIHRLLKEDGIMLLHSIGRMEPPGTTNSWTRKYIFPGGYVPALSEVTAAIEEKKIWATDMEILRLHYAETLQHWRNRCTFNRKAIEKMYDKKFYRMWEFYLVSSEVSFRYLNLMVFQLQLSKSLAAAPLTRDYMLQKPLEKPEIGRSAA